jgi:hypothetical protein
MIVIFLVCNFCHRQPLLLLIPLVKKPSCATVSEQIIVHVTQVYHNILLHVYGPQFRKLLCVLLKCIQILTLTKPVNVCQHMSWATSRFNLSEISPRP